jgi:alkylation response protein AidB-like acyl-CoA dehydrogenase
MPKAITDFDTKPSDLDFETFMSNYRAQLHNLFSLRTDLNELSVQRGLPPYVLRGILSCGPLSTFIPAQYGGRGGHVHEALSVLEASSYVSLPLALMVGINGALFLQPLANYGNEEIKGPLFERFVRHQNMGGLMITEPDYGSDALRMQTAYVEKNDHYHVSGLKHWAGLTGWADCWLITARKREESGNLARDVDFFVYDNTGPDQGIVVEEYFENLGLYMLPYGRNRIDLQVPKTHRLEPRTTGITMMLDILHRSRMQFPGMGMGFLRRMLDEAISHTTQRDVGGASLFTYDQVQARIARLQAYFTACSAMCAFTTENAGINRDLAKENLPANSIKTVVTDMMQEASQSLLQLFGATGYRLDHIAGRATVDSRSFQIFEGANDILYQQVSEAVVKSMRRMGDVSLYAYLKENEFTSRAADYFKDVLNFKPDPRMPQRRFVELGQAISRIVSMEFTISLGERGFRSDLIANSLKIFAGDVRVLIEQFNGNEQVSVVEDYQEDSGWLAFTTG